MRQKKRQQVVNIQQQQQGDPFWKRQHFKVVSFLTLNIHYYCDCFCYGFSLLLVNNRNHEYLSLRKNLKQYWIKALDPEFHMNQTWTWQFQIADNICFDLYRAFLNQAYHHIILYCSIFAPWRENSKSHFHQIRTSLLLYLNTRTLRIDV